MRKSALIVLVAAGGAALLLVAAAARSKAAVVMQPYASTSWLAAILAFGVFVVMLAEYFLHGRKVHLYLGAAFLALGITGMWEAMTCPFGAAARPATGTTYVALWQCGWITLAVMLVWGLVANRRPISESRAADAAAVAAAAVLWAALVVFLTSGLPAVSKALATARTGLVTSGACGLVFAAACFAYGRAAVHKNNFVLTWTAYGMVFAIFAQIAVALGERPGGPLFEFASLMKVLVFLSPLAGMLAEHTRLQVRLRDQASDLNDLVQAQQAVRSITTPAELYQRMADLISASFSAAAVCLMAFDKERGLLNVAARTGLDDDAARRLIFRPGEGPPGDSFSNKETIFVPDVFQDATLVRKVDSSCEIRSAVFAPLIVREECLGVLGVFFGGRPARRMSKEQLRMLDALANQAALAVDEHQLRGRVVDSTRASDDYAKELELVWEIGQAVTSKLELHSLVDTLAEKLRTAVGAKACSVAVYEPDAGELRSLGHGQTSRQEGTASHVDQCDIVAAAAAQKGEPVLVNDLPNSRDCKYPDIASDDEGTHHVMVVPMSLRGFSGAISVLRQDAEPFGEREKRLLMRLAPVVAAGVRNAELYEREKKIAESLEKSFLPEVGREYEGIQIASRYQAAYDESLVGGDFYDVIDLGEGRYGIAIGDVSGKGLDAAVYTAMARYMIQAYSADDPEPLSVITKLNGALCSYTPPGKFVTLVYGVLDTNSSTFTYVNAGHEIPFAYSGAEDKLAALQTTGPAAGALAEADYTSADASFEPGDMFIFYTDGATEVRSEGKFLGTEGLRKIVTDQIHRNLDNLPEAILTAIRSFAKGHLRDDIAILIVKARTPGALF